jgi:hypothetical protein
MKRARYSRAAHYPCGPEGVYVSALGDADAKGPGWPVRSGPLVSGPRAAGVRLRFLWHLGYDTMVTSEWALPTCSRTTWRRCQLVFELRPAYDPKAYGFNCVLSLGICRHRSGSGTGTAIPGVGEGDHHSSRAWYALSKQIYALLSQSSPNSTTSPNRKLDQALRRDGLWDRSFGRHAESTAIILRKASVDGVILHKPCVGRLQDVIANLKGMEMYGKVSRT